MNNYEFCIHWTIGQADGNPIRILDYGCGAGRIVGGLTARRFDAYGCDVFYEGGDYSSAADRELMDRAIRRMDGTRIPFNDACFDIVINNQVMEHVENLEAVLAEIDRVLKPDGRCLSLFPDKKVWREGHCGIPFLHRFPKHSRARVYYAAALRLCGLGYHTDGKSIMQWSRDFCAWLDQWTYYREYEEIARAYGRHFVSLRHIEHELLDARATGGLRIARLFPQWVKRIVVRKLAGMAFVCHKKPDGDQAPRQVHPR